MAVTERVSRTIADGVLVAESVSGAVAEALREPVVALGVPVGHGTRGATEGLGPHDNSAHQLYGAARVTGGTAVRTAPAHRGGTHKAAQHAYMRKDGHGGEAGT